MLGRFRYLFLDARYEKTREYGVADDAPCSPPSASSPPASAWCWASPSRSPRPRCTGAPSSKAWLRAACRAWSSSPPTTIGHQGSPQSRTARRPLAALPVPPCPERHPPRPNLAIRKAIGEELGPSDAPSLLHGAHTRRHHRLNLRARLVRQKVHGPHDAAPAAAVREHLHSRVVVRGKLALGGPHQPHRGRIDS